MIQRRLKRALAWRVKAVTSRLDAVAVRFDAIEQRLRSVDEKLAELGRSVDALQASASMLPHLTEEATAIRAAIDERVQPMLRVNCLEQRKQGQTMPRFDDLQSGLLLGRQL